MLVIEDLLTTDFKAQCSANFLDGFWHGNENSCESAVTSVGFTGEAYRSARLRYVYTNELVFVLLHRTPLLGFGDNTSAEDGLDERSYGSISPPFKV